MTKSVRAVSLALGITAMSFAGVAGAQYGGAPPGAGAIRKPTGTTCRTVQTTVESRVDAECVASGRRAVEVDERECTRLRDGQLEAVFTTLDERPQGCLPGEAES